MKCKICGEEFDPSRYVKECADILEEHEMCFSCFFWMNQHDLDLNGNEDGTKRDFAIVNGTHYVLESPTESYFKGFGGSPFYVKFNDGRVVKCTNMWCQGDIPENFREMMPDNAAFITKDEYEKLTADAESEQFNK